MTVRLTTPVGNPLPGWQPLPPSTNPLHQPGNRGTDQFKAYQHLDVGRGERLCVNNQTQGATDRVPAMMEVPRTPSVNKLLERLGMGRAMALGVDINATTVTIPVQLPAGYAKPDVDAKGILQNKFYPHDARILPLGTALQEALKPAKDDPKACFTAGDRDGLNVTFGYHGDGPFEPVISVRPGDVLNLRICGK